MNNTYEKCINIIEDKKTLNYSDLNTKWEEFKNIYPQLYNMLTLNNNIDMNILKFLCESSEKQKQLSTEEQLETDFEIGDQLAKKYIYNKFPEPSQEQKDYIKENIRKKINKSN